MSTVRSILCRVLLKATVSAGLFFLFVCFLDNQLYIFQVINISVTNYHH